ncbi:Holliday junction DNA helicase RuvB [Candidatus Falkowbacteria bacterium RIFOXYC2_FULL_47_12]|uniref:Holliday junction branch migration complex subunit RuvB n=2 Tax=Candidatus Falkowiibacteriota TaxID=1752728 RepID=A0A1F5TQ67_9BACT|nr:MAG: Holliday junction DNA helicase RuvB [Candidatus Falkowbacteria bacterium RIFOXYA2_FULL_47_9]OGF41123.1 MAG: Holliday junction DNA helicase RuvB [Candidatus Falkowbacteria bacterium RIFOXYC2_FULL_47_12]
MIQKKSETNRVVNASEANGDSALDQSLRPKNLADYVGQEKIKENLGIFMQAAKGRNEPIEHVLLYGAPGLGKTTLAHVIANEMGVSCRITSGPAIEKAGDLAAILSNLQEGDILFIDEIHRLNKAIEEILYPAMEDYALDIIIGKGPSARTLRIDLPKFTLIGATTKMSALSGPLRDRFGATYHLDFYTTDDIEKILTRSARILNVMIEFEACRHIASRSRRTPRVANRLLKRVRDYAEVRHDGTVTPEISQAALAMLEIDELGLDHIDRKVLLAMLEKFNGGPVGVNSIAAATGEEMATIEDVYEPYLLQLGFIERTPRGRVVTDLARKHLGVAETNRQNALMNYPAAS